jgi:hypothetical protein
MAMAVNVPSRKQRRQCSGCGLDRSELLSRTSHASLEGGINAGLKDLLRAHRGLSPDHAASAIDYLYLRTEQPRDPWHRVRPHHWQPQKKKPTHAQAVRTFWPLTR